MLVSRRSMLDTVRKSIRMLPADRRWWWAALPILAALTGAAEAAAAGAVFGLVKIIADPAAVASVPVARLIAPHLPWQDGRGLILEFTLLVAVYHVAKNVLVVGAQYARHKIVGESTAALACTMLRGYLLASYPFHFRRHSAELIRNTTHSVHAVLMTLSAAGAIFSELLVGAGIAAVLLTASPLATIVTGVVLGTVVVLLLRWTRRLAHRAGHGGHELNRELLQTLQQALGAIKEIKALGREGFFYRTYAEKQRELLALGYLGVTLEAIPPVVVESVFVCGALLVVAVLTVTGEVASQGLPLLGLFAYAGLRVIPMANRLTWRANEIRESQAGVQSLYEDHRLVTGAGWNDAADDAPPLEMREAIALEGVSYTYPGASIPALHDVTLTIRHGESIGFAGATGAGKSTLVDVVMGLLPPSTGRVTIDGVELDARRERTWRRHVGYVPQSIFLLDDTLARNIALGIADDDIDPERVRRALRVAQLEALVASLPDGLETRLGEHGVRLSGGERQRVGIARALYHDPDVLVLDEATSALDDATASAVTDAIRGLHGSKTVLLIAHRLDALRGCDRIALVAGGRLLDYASYDELLARSDEFRRLAMVADAAPATATQRA
jgi:ATP-binding cassette subfamily C protein